MRNQVGFQNLPRGRTHTVGSFPMGYYIPWPKSQWFRVLDPKVVQTAPAVLLSAMRGWGSVHGVRRQSRDMAKSAVRSPTGSGSLSLAPSAKTVMASVHGRRRLLLIPRPSHQTRWSLGNHCISTAAPQLLFSDGASTARLGNYFPTWLHPSGAEAALRCLLLNWSRTEDRWISLESFIYVSFTSISG